MVVVVKLTVFDSRDVSITKVEGDWCVVSTSYNGCDIRFVGENQIQLNVYTQDNRVCPSGHKINLKKRFGVTGVSLTEMTCNQSSLVLTQDLLNPNAKFYGICREPTSHLKMQLDSQTKFADMTILAFNGSKVSFEQPHHDEHYVTADISEGGVLYSSVNVDICPLKEDLMDDDDRLGKITFRRIRDVDVFNSVTQGYVTVPEPKLVKIPMECDFWYDPQDNQICRETVYGAIKN